MFQILTRRLTHVDIASCINTFYFLINTMRNAVRSFTSELSALLLLLIIFTVVFER